MALQIQVFRFTPNDSTSALIPDGWKIESVNYEGQMGHITVIASKDLGWTDEDERS